MVGDVQELTSIPADYGSLIAVTTAAKYSEWAQLWFVDEIGTIRMVRVNWEKNLFLEDPVVITRNYQQGEVESDGS
jgi:hypothetical protein